MTELFRRALEYVRDNVEQIDIERALYQMEREKLPLRLVNNDLELKLRDLMDEYGSNNGLGEGWWMVHQDYVRELIGLLADIIWPDGYKGAEVKGLDKAPLNQKDIMVDGLFEDLFSDGWIGYIENNHQVMGWIQDIPVMLEWSFNVNQIKVTPLSGVGNASDIDSVAEVIERRLTRYNDEDDCMILCKTSRFYKEDGMPVKVHAWYYYKPFEQ